MIPLTKEEAADRLEKIVWNYKVGDNIATNFKQLFFLYGKQSAEPDNDKKKLFNKSLTVLLVSIIEAILYDFIVRLSDSTNHFPDHIPEASKEKIKAQLHSQKQWFKSNRASIGRYKRVKNYSLSELKEFLETYELLGNKGRPIYSELENAIYLRNRIHIFNWFGNFELDEERVFTEFRLQRIENLLVHILDGFVKWYSRPFDSGQARVWLEKIQ